MPVPFHHIHLIGLGLIGASVAHKLRALKQSGDFSGVVSGFAPSAKTRTRAVALNLLDKVASKMEEGIREADLVILCSPPSTFAEVAALVGQKMKAGAVLSDVGSFKCRAIEDIAPHLGAGNFFVPAHPIAGTERSGINAGFASLFEKRWAILTPLKNSEAPYLNAVAQVKDFWHAMGSKVSQMDAAHHDRVLALTSHLPHIVAWTMVAASQTQDKISKQEVIDYSGGGFKDFTRLASSDPLMWRDVLLGNQQSVLEMIDGFAQELEKLRAAIDKKDGAFLQDFFTQTRNMRDLILDAEKKLK